MKPGDKVICIDDQGWIITDPGFEHLAPKKGSCYTVREYLKFGGVAAISLMEGNEDGFYRAMRFRLHRKSKSSLKGWNSKRVFMICDEVYPK